MGKISKLYFKSKLVQEWFGGDWAKPSIVILLSKKMVIGTILELEQSDVPDEEFEDIDKGWDELLSWSHEENA